MTPDVDVGSESGTDPPGLITETKVLMWAGQLVTVESQLVMVTSAVE